jgi:hypothetical protein
VKESLRGVLVNTQRVVDRCSLYSSLHERVVDEARRLRCSCSFLGSRLRLHLKVWGGMKGLITNEPDAKSKSNEEVRQG